MDGSILGGFTLLAIGLVLTAVVFLALRELVLWYFKINQIVANLAVIADHYRAIGQASAQQHPPVVHPPTALVGLSAPIPNK